MTSARRTAARLVALTLATGLVLATEGAPAQAETPVAGALTSGDPLFPHQGNGGYDVAHYDVDLAWTPGLLPLTPGTITATTTIQAATTGAPLSSFGLDLEGDDLTVSAVTVDGVAAGFTRTDGTGTEPPPAHKLVVTPATPVDGAFTTVVTYAGSPDSHTDTDGSSEGWNPTLDGATFLNQPIGAMTGFPHNNTPADKATYTFELDIPTSTGVLSPQPLTAVSNGELVSRTAAGSRTTWVWQQTEQMASELVLISIGRYDMVTSDVTLSSGRVIPEWSFVDSALSASAKTTFTERRAQLGAIIRRLESIYGPYPGNSTGVVVDTVPAGINYALETQDRSFFPTVTSLSGSTLQHELVHQWFGDAVSPRVWNDIWINEGMAEWGPTWEANVLAATDPDPEAVETTWFNSWNSTASTSASWATPPAGMTSTDQLYGYQTYTRGAQFYEALRTAIGTPAFLELVATWQARGTGESRGSADFEALAEEVSGRDLTAFVADWVHEAGKPAWPAKYDLALSATPAGQLEPGETVTFTLSSTNTGKVPQTGTVVTVDVTDVVDDATIGSLPPGVTLSGGTLTWAVPSTPVRDTVTAVVQAVLRPGVTSGTLSATARAATLGSTCVACTVSPSVVVEPVSPAPTPTVTGTAQVGEPLVALAGAWDPQATLAYQWRAGGEPVPGATGTTYTPGAAQVGKTITVAVTGTRDGFGPVTRTSTPTAAVALGDQTRRPTPTVTGAARVDGALSAVPGTWDDGTTLAYQWFRGSRTVAGATEQTYRPTPRDVGARLSVAVISTRPGYSPAYATSEPTATVARGVQTRTPTPTITGKPRAGRTLKVATGVHDDGVKVAVQWLANGKAVKGATARTLRLTDRLVGKRITVRVRATKPGYTAVVRTSRATTPVRR